MEIDHYTKIPFLPIQFFKTEKVQCGSFIPELVFMSSGTGGNRSTHPVFKSEWYEKAFLNTFEQFYGDSSEYCILALLPNYLEQGESSLVYMCDSLIKKSNHSESGFFLYDHEELTSRLIQLATTSTKTLLIGVSFALLDFALTSENIDFPELIIMETGGMKGRKKELVREELHTILNTHFGSSTIHSEYGMTELMSQAYASKNGLFECPSWMKVLIRQQENPFVYADHGQVGGINIIDLTNLYSCSFIQTDDLGRLNDNRFEVLGRFDHSEIRGCSQLAT